MKKIKIRPGQTVMDIAIQEYGNIEAIFEILDLNTHILNDYPEHEAIADRSEFDLGYSIKTGQELTVNPQSDLFKKSIIEELNNKIIISE